MSQFIVSEACEVPYKKNNKGVKHISAEEKNAFWEKHRKYASKNGCYIFAIQTRGMTPFYVGKSSRHFYKEIFTDHKLGKYNNVLHSYTRGTPYMFFITPASARTRISIPKLSQIETYLIQSAARANENLVNIKGTTGPSWSIKGVTKRTKGSPKKTDMAFIGMLKIKQW